MNRIITISRSHGSGGREIGRMLAEKLNVPFYDRQLIEEAAQESGLSVEDIANAEKKAGNTFLYSLYMNMTSPKAQSLGYKDSSVNDIVFSAQSEVIRRYAQKGPCVIVGRAADYVLQDIAEVISVFIDANDDARIHRLMDRRELDEETATAQMKRMDKQRKNYYEYHTDRQWGQATHYELTLRSDLIGLEKCVDIIKDYEARVR